MWIWELDFLCNGVMNKLDVLDTLNIYVHHGDYFTTAWGIFGPDRYIDYELSPSTHDLFE